MSAPPEVAVDSKNAARFCGNDDDTDVPTSSTATTASPFRTSVTALAWMSPVMITGFRVRAKTSSIRVRAAG